jgi:hypothetical protein
MSLDIKCFFHGANGLQNLKVTEKGSSFFLTEAACFKK